MSKRRRHSRVTGAVADFGRSSLPDWTFAVRRTTRADIRPTASLDPSINPESGRRLQQAAQTRATKVLGKIGKMRCVDLA